MDRGKQTKQMQLTAQIGIALTAGMFSIVPVAHGAPVLDSVVSGGAAVAVSGATTDITSKTVNNVINWQDFSVAKGEQVRFDKGAQTNNYLNIVTGANSSQINGAISGGKNVYLVNPNGVIFGSDARINVGNLYVSTRPISEVNTTAINASGDMTPLVDTASQTAGDVVNMGSIAANSVTVEGNNIKFMDVEQVTDLSGATNSDVALTATGSIRLGQNIESANYGLATAATDYDTNMAAAGFTTITTASGLTGITDMTGDYELGSDIDLSGVTYTSLGDKTTPFSGNFDGNFYEISGISQNYSAKDTYGGLFGYTNGANISNLGVTNGSITAAVAGAIAGKAVDTTFTNVYNENVAVKSNRKGLTGSAGGEKNFGAGGIVGSVSGTTIDTAYNTGLITNGGGIVGFIAANNTIKNVYNSNSSVENGIAGVSADGAQTTSSIDNAYTTGSQYGYSTMAVVPTNSYKGVTSTSASDYSDLDISASGSDNTAWRIYEGQTLPLLRAFLRRGGSAVTVSYDYAMGTTTGSNGGSDLTNKELTYNGNYLTTSDVSYSGRDDIDTSLISYVGSGTSTAGGTSSLKKATSATALFYTGQKGYDLIGNNVAIEKRTIKIDSNAKLDLSKIYDGDTDATDAFKTAFENAGSDTAGIISGDDVEVGYSDDFAAAFKDKNVGQDKDVSLNGTLSITGGADADNYTLADGGVLNNVTIYGDITPRTLYLTVNKLTGIDKTYDGTSVVTDADAIPTANITLDKNSSDTDHSVVSGDSVDLGALGSTATYVDVDGATVTATANAGDHKVLYTGIGLTGTDAGNYQLAYKNGSTETVITDGTMLLDGTINRRLILSDAFQVKDAAGNVANGTKVYDGTSDYTLGDGYSLSTGSTSASGDTGIISADDGKITFALSGSGAHFTDGTNATVNVADATNIAYSVVAQGDSDVLANYKIGTSDATATDLTAGGTYDVLGAGTITRRALTVGLATDKGIDKVYDATNVVTDTKYLADNVGYDTGSAKLLADEGGSVTDDAAWNVSAAYASANVVRDANGDPTTQNVNYVIALTGDAAANYTLNGVNGESASVTLTATGTISPKDVTASFATVSKTYNGTTALDGDVTASSASLTGLLDADNGKVTVNYDTNNASFDSKNAGSRTVTYKGVSLAGTAAGNYNLASDEATAAGTINKRAITSADITATFGKIEKTYDNLTTADATQLQSLTVNNVTGDDLVFSVTNAVYNNKNRLGNADLQTNGVTYTVSLTDAEQLKNYTLGNGLSGNALSLTTDGYIYQKELTVAAVDSNLTKQYDATQKVIGSDGSVLTGDKLVTITGLENDGTTNATTALYDDKNAGTRTVKYTLALNEPEGNNYKFVDANGNTITSITDGGTITKRQLYAKFNDVSKVYDTNSAVANSDITATLVGADGTTADSVAASEGVTLTTSAITGTYGTGTDASFAADANVGSKSVQYTNLIAALGANADNYTIADTSYGAGSITPATISADDFKFTFDTITKTYDGTPDIGTTAAANAVLNHYIDLGLTTNPEYTYTINSATYADKNAGTGKAVTYTITISGLSQLTNYEITGVTGDTLTQSYTLNNGVIDRKAVYAAIKNNALTKTYDATTAVKDANGNVISGDSIITLDGLTNNDGATNISTGAYADKKVGNGDKVINYNVALDSASAGNYVIYAESDRNNPTPTEITTLSSYTNTITPAKLALTFSTATKDYDGTTAVITSATSANPTLAAGFSGDTVSLATGYAAEYDDPNVKGLNGDGKHTVTYDNLALTGADAGNYILVDSTGTALSASTTTAGTYTTTGDGVINKFKLTTAPTFTIKNVTKEYDGTNAVSYTGTGKDGTTYYYRDKSADARQNYIDGATVTVNGKEMPVYYTIKDATYTGTSVGDYTNGVSFVVTLSGDNYDFSSLIGQGLDADGNFTGAATTTSGTITKRHIYVTTDDAINIEKTYDGKTNVVNDVTNKVILTDDDDILDVDKGKVDLDRTALNATYYDKDAGTGKTVYYTVTLTGDAAGNYEIHDYNNQGTSSDDAITTIASYDGIINKKALTISITNGIDKEYDGTSTIDTTKIASSDIYIEGLENGESFGTLDAATIAKISGDYGTGTSAGDFTADANVSWSGDNVSDKAIHYDLSDLADLLTADDNAIGKNYTIDADARELYYTAADKKGKITPIYVDNATQTWGSAEKIYDATEDLPTGKTAQDYLTITASAKDGKVLNVDYTTSSAGYDNKNVGTDHQLVYDIDGVKQKLSADGGTNYNYYLTDNTTAGILGEQNSGNTYSTIKVRDITATLGKDSGINKTYDGTKNVLAPYTGSSNLTLTADDLAVLKRDGITPNIKSEYYGKDVGAHEIAYTIEGINSSNYNLTNGGIYTATGEITKATLNIDFGAIDRTYEKGNTAIKLTGDKITLTGVAGETVTLDDAALALITGNYGKGGSASAFTADDNVSWNGSTVANKDVLYTGLAAALDSLIAGGDTIASNYTIADTAYFTAAQAKGKIKPIAITQGATANWTTADKTYDATTNVANADKYLDITYTDANGDVVDIGYNIASANYDSKNVSDNRTLNYMLSSLDKKLTADGTNYNYVLDDNYAAALTNQAWTSAANNSIKKLSIGAGLLQTTGIDKTYDGTTDVLDAYQGASNLVIDKDALAVLARDGIGTVITEAYDSKNAGDRTVTYTLGLDTASDNYELASDTYTATGTIARRGLTIVAEPVKVRVGDVMPNFSGTVTGYVDSDKSLIEEFQNKLLNFKTGDDVTTTKPGHYAVYGWYTNGAGTALTAGDFGQNYTFSQDASNDTAFYVELIDPGREYHENVNPKTQFIPNNTAYNQAAMDYSGAYSGTGAAALEYQDSAGTVLGEITIGDGQVTATGGLSGATGATGAGAATVTTGATTGATNGATSAGTTLAGASDVSYGIAGDNVVNVENLDVASSASVEVSGDGEIVNLEVRPLTSDESSAEIAIENTDSIDN